MSVDDWICGVVLWDNYVVEEDTECDEMRCSVRLCMWKGMHF